MAKMTIFMYIELVFGIKYLMNLLNIIKEKIYYIANISFLLIIIFNIINYFKKVNIIFIFIIQIFYI